MIRPIAILACTALAVLARAGELGAQVAEPPPAEGIRLDFQDVDLRLVISALAEAGNLNVVYADLPERSVTLRMSRPVSPDEVLGLLRSLAASNGLEVMEEGSLIRVVGRAGPEAEAPLEEEPVEGALRLYVHRLKHVRAASLAATLQSIFGGQTGGQPVDRPGFRSFSESMRDQGVPPSSPDAPPDVQIDLTPTQPTGIPAELAGLVQIVPDETTNSLIIRAQPEDWAVIRQAIEALDLRPLQVLIEVVIAEVRRSSDLQLGVSFGAENQDQQGVDTRLELQGNSAGNFVLEVMRFGATNVNGLVSALATDGNVRIVSRPVILAQNNQQARILVGAERPFIQVFRSLPTDAAVRDQVVQYRDVGTSLSIVPTINSDGYVNLELTQEVNTATSEEQFGAPIISTREAATQLFVRDGQTVVIGGLIDRQRTESESGVPLLKDIPLLGRLFKSTSTETIENELFMFLTPHIVESDEDADRVLEELGAQTELLEVDSIIRTPAADTIRASEPDTIRSPRSDTIPSPEPDTHRPSASGIVRSPVVGAPRGPLRLP